MDNVIGAKIESAEAFKEEITNADTYQMTLDDPSDDSQSLFARLACFHPNSSDLLCLCQHRSRPSTQPPLETSRRSELRSNFSEERYGYVNTNTHSLDSSSIPQVTCLPLPTFSGDLLNWQTFWDSFDAAVNQNVDLSGVQKFTYLDSQVQGMLPMLLQGGDDYAHSVTLLENYTNLL